MSFVKSFVLSKALHAAQILACPKKIAVATSNAVSIFLWRGKRKRGIVFQKAEKGGLRYLHVWTFFNAILAKTNFIILIGNPGPERENVLILAIIPLEECLQVTLQGHLDDYLENFASLMKQLKEE